MGHGGEQITLIFGGFFKKKENLIGKKLSFQKTHSKKKRRNGNLLTSSFPGREVFLKKDFEIPQIDWKYAFKILLHQNQCENEQLSKKHQQQISNYVTKKCHLELARGFG